MRRDDGAGGCYTIPMGLCYGKRIQGTDGGAGTPSPGRLSSPLRGAGGGSQGESLHGFGVCGGKGGGKQPPRGAVKSLATAFPYKCGSLERWPMERRASASLWPVYPGTVLQRRVAMEVAFLGGSAVPEGQVPLPLSALASALPLELGTIGTYRPMASTSTRGRIGLTYGNVRQHRRRFFICGKRVNFALESI